MKWDYKNSGEQATCYECGVDIGERPRVIMDFKSYHRNYCCRCGCAGVDATITRLTRIRGLALLGETNQTDRAEDEIERARRMA